MTVVYDRVMPPKSGLALEIRTGQHLTVTDLEGQQVVDMAIFDSHNHREKLSTSYSRTRRVPRPGETYRAVDRLTEGDVLRSTLGRPMMTILRETQDPKGVHDTHHRMCNSGLYESYGLEPRDGCLELMAKAVKSYGLRPEDIPDTIDLFMNFEHDVENGRWVIKLPVSKPGDYIEFRADTDCLVAFSNCPEDVLTPCNAYHCTPVRIQISDETA